MRSTHFLMFAAALGTPAAICASPCLAPAAEIEATSKAESEKLLIPLEQLDEINLSIVDDKLAMSLAVEAHVQIELTEFALDMIGDEQLKRLTEHKLHVYRQLYNTLDELTGGRADAMLGRQAAADGDGDVPHRKRTRSRGGIGSILQNTATKAITRVRLEIANQYLELLRAELELAPPGEFDRRYICIELYNQMQVLAMLRVFEQQASPEFGRLIHLATVSSEGQVVEARELVERMTNTLTLPEAKSQVVNTAELTVE